MKKMLTLLVALCGTMAAWAQAPEAKAAEGYQFTDVKVIETTPVKNQNRSGTCWCYSTMTFLEAEILRAGGEAVHLSEMFAVRHAYMKKAEMYVRMHGHLNFAEGGAAHDVTEVIKEYGIVPNEVYTGMNYGTELADFHEITPVMTAYLDAVIKAGDTSRRPLTTAWKRGFNAILDEYFGELPESFVWKGKEYTPKSFAESLPIDMDDYIDLSSFTHHPFYEQFVLEVPDNWMWGRVYNLPMEEMMRVVDHALENGYTLAWGTDVSEKGFSRTKAIGVIPETDPKSMSGTEAERWGSLTAKEREAALYSFEKPTKEREITQEMRQEAFDNYETTDDHGMVIVGTAKDQNGTIYYKVQNSWDTVKPYDGFWYFSKPFVAYKTTDLMVNKKALPKDIAKKLGL
ncbi:MAG: aminopeptidase [Rikenellaceae bacterium]|nr:aminopeptidase [Rikenellaceae bacterium]